MNISNNFFYKYYKKTKAKMAIRNFWNPAENMFIIGITWTDWKSTTTNILHKILNDNIWKSCLISTINYKIWEQNFENNTKMTSLDPTNLHWILKAAKDQGCKIAILEVSSHALEQERFYWIDFDMWILTNITPEHLDYHKTMEDYANAKKKLFKQILWNKKKNKCAVLPKDNEYWRKWFEEMSFDREVDYWVLVASSLKVNNITESLDWTDFEYTYLWTNNSIHTNLLWKFNVSNILAAIGWALIMWVSHENIKKSIAQFAPLPWRLEKVVSNWVTYLIDFAHTPNALDVVHQYIQKVKWNWKIITLFWAPWNRDPFKRPKMWEMVSRFADIMIVTDDDPDSENRFDIISDILKWIKNRELGENLYVIPERELAIKMAVDLAKPWDIVLLAWKWHENIQVTNTWKRQWNDRKQLEKMLSEKK